MAQRSIAGQNDAEGDGSLTTSVAKRLGEAMDNDGDADPRRVVDAVRSLAEALPPIWTPAQEKAALAYIDALAEPNRTIFSQHLNGGATAREIARSTGLSHIQVLKSLAKIYSALRHI